MALLTQRRTYDTSSETARPRSALTPAPSGAAHILHRQRSMETLAIRLWWTAMALSAGMLAAGVSFPGFH